MPTWAVGSKNAAKVACVRDVLARVWPAERGENVVVAVDVQSAVSAQPMSAAETRAGALHRARAALEATPGADFGVGLEGGVERVELAGAGEAETKYFECGWMCVVERSTGRIGFGSSARFEMSSKLMTPLLEQGKELAEVIDAITGERDVRSGLGAMGVLTAGHLGRAEAYSHGMIFALAPFLTDREKFWD